jgi:hypothetical protein
MTCNVNTKDIIFHVLFGSDIKLISDLVVASAQRLYDISRNTLLHSTMGMFIQKQDTFAPIYVKLWFFILINMDMVLKEYICDPLNPKLYAAALNIPVTSVSKKHSLSVIGTKPMKPEAARGFMIRLRIVIQEWLSHEDIQIPELFNKIREEYLIS